MLVSWSWRLTLLAAALGCELVPSDDAPPKSPGDNFYRVIVNGEVERYAPNQRYVGEFPSIPLYLNFDILSHFRTTELGCSYDIYRKLYHSVTQSY